LDWYAENKRQNMVRNRRVLFSYLKSQPSYERDEIKQALVNPGKALQKSCTSSMRVHGTEVDYDGEEMIHFLHLVAPFCCDGIRLPPLAIAIGADVAHSLNEQDCHSDEALITDFLKTRSTIYIDVAHHSYLVTNSVQLRAIFVYFDGSHKRFSGIFTRPGCNNGRRINWRAGRWNASPFGAEFDELFWAASSDFRGKGSETIVSEILEDRDNAFKLIERFADNAVMSLLQLTNDEKIERLPQVPIISPQRIGRRSAQRLADRSLFSVVKLTAQQVQANRVYGDADSQGISRARRLHHVSGHYRWQACGPGRRDRKRKWIRSFQRGSIAQGKVTSMKILRDNGMLP
ncbi:hypothetical protein, partial [Pseudorhizobium flavum]|uniref:hypothetical protein n=1 Tax=Pseudorhizobium flavum TaxID=1335061 RepID=UPI00376FE726